MSPGHGDDPGPRCCLQMSSRKIGKKTELRRSARGPGLPRGESVSRRVRGRAASWPLQRGKVPQWRMLKSVKTPPGRREGGTRGPWSLLRRERSGSTWPQRFVCLGTHFPQPQVEKLTHPFALNEPPSPPQGTLLSLRFCCFLLFQKSQSGGICFSGL